MISYGANMIDRYRQAARYVDRILAGALRIDCSVPAQMTAKKLDGGIAAVDDKFAAGHKRSVIGGQEYDCGGDLFRACRPAQQRRSEQALGHRSILQEFLDHRC